MADDLPDWADLAKALEDALVRAVQMYRADCVSFAQVHPVLATTGYAIARRDPDGGGGDWHAPSFVRPRPVVAVVVFLNDVDGGELAFEAHAPRFAPRAGLFLLFPTGFEYVYREAAPATPKYTMTTFLTFPARAHG